MRIIDFGVFNLFIFISGEEKEILYTFFKSVSFLCAVKIAMHGISSRHLKARKREALESSFLNL